MFAQNFRAIISFIIFVLLATACGSEPETANINTTPFPQREDTKKAEANDSAEELGMLIEMPFEPTEVVWREITPGSENGDNAERRLVAVLRFDPGDISKVTEAAGKLGDPTDGSITIEEWFPRELAAKSDVDGASGLAAKIYSADSFFRPPYLSGTFAHLNDTDYFVLQLTAR
jgi:hypothetical protein